MDSNLRNDRFTILFENSTVSINTKRIFEKKKNHPQMTQISQILYMSFFICVIFIICG